MYRTLFDIAGIAMLGWALLIFLPTWRVTRRLAESAAFPVFLAALYLVGIAAVVSESGVGFMGDFSSADGVLGLLATEPVALIAWIHILAFDQLVGVLIYRDNMSRRIVPLPLQSLILVGTLMLGPIGFLTYWTIRTVRGRTLVAWGDQTPRPVADRPAATGIVVPHFRAIVNRSSITENVRGVLARSPAIVAISLFAFVMATLTVAIAAINGGWLLGEEGRLLEAVKFNGALGVYSLTLAFVLPFAPFSERRRRRWIAWAVGLTVFAVGVESIQSWRGLDPRFSNIAGPVDSAIGGVFFLSAIGVMVLFIVLVSRFFTESALPDHPGLRLALRYGAASALIAFAVGLVMTALNSRLVGSGGDLMPVHAAGFHAMQAVPLVALLLGTLPLREASARFAIHAAGVGWFLLCTGLVIQAGSGLPLLAGSPALGVMLGGLATWAAAVAYAVRERYFAAPTLAGVDRP